MTALLHFQRRLSVLALPTLCAGLFGSGPPPSCRLASFAAFAFRPQSITTMSAQAQANKKQRFCSLSRSTSTADAQPTNNNMHHDIELLSAWFCPYAQRAWIALNEKLGVGNFQTTEAMIVVDKLHMVCHIAAPNPSPLRC